MFIRFRLWRLTAPCEPSFPPLRGILQHGERFLLGMVLFSAREAALSCTGRALTEAVGSIHGRPGDTRHYDCRAESDVARRGRRRAQARSDGHLTALWLHGRSAGAYRADLAAFLAHVRLPLGGITLGDVQGYQDTFGGLATASPARKLSAVKCC